SARLHIAASDPVYCTVVDIGSPPVFQTVQMSGRSVVPEKPQSGPRIVFPQAVVGELQGQIYQAELRLANRNATASWSGVVRLLRQQDLQGMSGLRVTDRDQTPVEVVGGEFPVTIGVNETAFYRVSGGAGQIGVMIIEPGTSSSIGDVVPSFYYRV